MNVETASRLAKLRRQSGLSQEELAEKIGVSRQAVSKWERAESSPDTDNLIALAKIYKLSLDDMLHSKDINVASMNKATGGTYQNTEGGRSKVNWVAFPYPILATIIYFVLGFVWDAWHPGWLVFLTIPIWAFFVGKDKKEKKKNKKKKKKKEA